jgi:hypothetical protein
MNPHLSSLAMNMSDVGTKAIVSLQVRVETREQNTNKALQKFIFS